jgi:hypothetical protein
MDDVMMERGKNGMEGRTVGLLIREIDQINN